MNIEIVAKDNNGVSRCYGLGKNRFDAITKCISASREYLKTRPDIKELFLYDGNTDKPIYDAANYEIWTVKL